jgi:vancomycin permeability regulator SanA
MPGLRRVIAFVVALLVLVIAGAALVYRSIPAENTPVTDFNAIIVLGTPANADGTPSPEQRERTLEGVREFQAGVAPHLIFTGGPAHNRFVEAHVMAMLALAQGVPANAIIEEDQAQNTIQNIFYSRRIMTLYGWTSAEVISSPSHLPRTALILKHYPMRWRVHRAPWPPEYSFWQRAIHYSVEAEYCLRLEIFGFPATRFLPSHTWIGLTDQPETTLNGRLPPLSSVSTAVSSGFAGL